MLNHLKDFEDIAHVEEQSEDRSKKSKIDSRFVVKTQNGDKGSNKRKSDCEEACKPWWGNMFGENVKEVNDKLFKITNPKVNCYQCEKCGLISSSKGYLRRHKDAQHEGRQFNCDLCEFQSGWMGVSGDTRSKSMFRRTDNNRNNQNVLYTNGPNDLKRKVL